MTEENSVLEYKTKQDLIYTELYNGIVSGRYRPGEYLQLNEIAARLGASRTPVREAIWRLESEGLVNSLPHRGFMVAKIPAEEMVELYHMRAVLEGLAARLAAGRLSEAAGRELRSLVNQMHALVASGDYDKIIALNQPFHDLIYRAAASPLLYKYITSLYAATTRYRGLTATWPGRTAEIAAEHEVLAEAVIRGDAEQAERLARTHHENNAATLVQLVKSLEEAQELEAELEK